MSNPAQSQASDGTEASFTAWKAEVERALKGADFDKRLVTRTLEGIDVQPLYTARDLAAGDPSGFPGSPPYRRGALPVGRHGIDRDIRAHYGNPDADKLRGEIAQDLARDVRSLWLSFDGAVRAGTAPEGAPRDERLRGVPCVNAAQLAALLENVPIDRVALSLDAGSNALAVAACLFHVAKQRGLPLAQLSGSLNADPLAALARDGALPYALQAAREQLVSLAQWTAVHAPQLRAVTISTVPYHDAGAHAAQELAYALATGVSYLRWLCEGGLDVPKACAQLAFRFSVGSDFFMEIAKLRAMRQCWANVVQASGGSALDQQCVIHAVTSARTKTQRDPWVNLLRETTEAFAAAAGGADAITTRGFDRLAGVEDAFARRIASNTQVILDEEAHVSAVADPAGGAWYVEALTDGLIERAWALLQDIEARGGMEAHLRSGALAAQIGDVANARASQIAKRKQVITGVSEYANIDEERVKRAEPNWQAIQAQRASMLASGSKDETVAKPLIAAQKAKQGIVEAAIEVAGRGANLGQLSCALAGAGDPARMTPLPQGRDAQAYERLRDACDECERATGKRPSVFSCNLGKIAEHKARAQFAAGLFSAGGLSVSDNDGFADVHAAAEAFARSGTKLVVICGTDDAYAQTVEALAPLLRARGATRIILAGRPLDAEARYRAAGVTDFVFMGCDVVAVLTQVLTALGVVP